MTPNPGRSDEALAALAAQQHGIVDVDDLRRLGLTRDAISWRVALGRLHRRHPGVYAVGHPALSPDGRTLAAVRSAGPGAVLSHLSAAVLWGLRTGSPAKWDVTSPLRSGGRSTLRPLVRCHRTRRLPPHHVTTVRAVPVTTVARTLVDCAAIATPREVARYVHEAQVLRMLDVADLDRVIADLPGRAGIPKLRAALERPADGPSRTAFVTAFLDLCADHGLEEPRTFTHLPALGRLIEVDALFPAERVIVELDGEAVHGTTRRFHEDRRRDTAFAARGYLTLRLTWQRVTREAAAVAGELREVLALRAPTVDRRPR
jgi:very-short-patch-repair endonuclease